MRRSTALLTGLTFLSAWTPVSAAHLHAYADHEHPEHHHGLVAHEHLLRTVDVVSRDGQRLQECDPVDHVIGFDVVGAVAPDLFAADAIPGSGPAVGDPNVARRTPAIPDPRAHGPPLRSATSPRAPPHTLPA